VQMKAFSCSFCHLWAKGRYF